MKLTRTDYLTALVGFVTGGPIGAVLSPFIYRNLARGGSPPWVWGLLGITFSPILWALTILPFVPSTPTTTAPAPAAKAPAPVVNPPASAPVDVPRQSPPAESAAKSIEPGTVFVSTDPLACEAVVNAGDGSGPASTGVNCSMVLITKATDGQNYSIQFSQGGTTVSYITSILNNGMGGFNVVKVGGSTLGGYTAAQGRCVLVEAGEAAFDRDSADVMDHDTIGCSASMTRNDGGAASIAYASEHNDLTPEIKALFR